jgi:Ca-activated chloride channel homolog
MIRPVADLPLLLLATLVLLTPVVFGVVWSRRRERTGWLLRIVMVLLLLAIGLRPGLGSQPAPTVVLPLEVVVAIDRTTSMSAHDWNGDRARLDGVRRDVADLVEALPSGRFTVVTFGRSVRTELPSTQDQMLIGETVALVRREPVFSGKGSRTDRPLQPLRRLLTRMQDQNPDRPRLLVLMADGENTDARAQRSYAPLRPLVDAGAVLGYGTVRGGLMPVDEDEPDGRWVLDPATGTPARSTLDERNLGAVAEELGVPYHHRLRPGGMQPLASTWQGAFTDTAAPTGKETPARYELTWVLALLLLAVALVDLRRHWRRMHEARRELA